MFVSRASRKPTPIPAQIRATLARIGGAEAK